MEADGAGVGEAGEPTFADLEYQGKRRRTRRELFLERIRSDPVAKLEERIRPVYAKRGMGRRPIRCRRCCIHCVQLFYNLSDPGMEDLLTTESLRRFVGSLSEALHETTILNFRHLLPTALLEEINTHRPGAASLRAGGRQHHRGTVSTKNRAGERDPEMHPEGEPVAFREKAQLAWIPKPG